MKILPIMNVPTNTNTGMTRTNAQSFKGLKGETHTQDGFNDFAQGINETEHVTAYHPFLGESDREIQQAVKEHFHSGEHNYSNAIGYGNTDIDTHRLEVKERLPFTKSEFDRFKSGELQRSSRAVDRTLADMIERNIKKFHL